MTASVLTRRPTPRTTDRRTGPAALRSRRLIWIAVLVLLAVALSVASLTTGEVPVSLPNVLDGLFAAHPTGAAYVVAEFRRPRVLGAVLVGLGLGAAGAVTQSLLRNPLASPDIIGVTAGASAAAVLSLAGGSGLALAQGWVSGMPLALAALGGGLLAGIIVLLCAWRRGLAPHRVVLVGLGVNAGFGALTSWLLLRADLSGLTSALTWLTGSLNQVRVGALGPVTLLLAAGFVALALGARTLGLLRYDPRVAGALGVSVAPAQLWLLGLAVGIAAVTTAVAGPVPFVAFVAPQIALVLLRTEGPPVGGAALVGAVMMLGSDLVAARLFPVPLPVGLVTSFVGVPVLLWLLLRGRRRAAA